MRPNNFEIQNHQLKSPPKPTVVRTLHDFYVVDTSPDFEPSWILPEVLAIGSQDCAFSDQTKSTFSHVINVGSRIPNAFEGLLVYKRIEMLDLPDYSLTEHFEELHKFIDQCLSKEGNKLLIHCQAGVSRSATVAISYLMLLNVRSGREANLVECMEKVKLARKVAKPNEGFMKQLQVWETQLNSTLHFNEMELNERSSVVSKPPVIVRIRRLMGLLRFMYITLRPTIAIFLIFLSAFTRIKNRTFVRFLTCGICFDLYQDEVFKANFFGKLSKGAKPGVYYRGNNSKIGKILKTMGNKLNYQVPTIFRVLGGDIATLSFVLAGYQGQPITFRRENVSLGKRRFSLDWAYPANNRINHKVCLLLPGIGGNSHSAYVKDIAATLVKEGTAVAVLLARGLSTCSWSHDLDSVFNPTDDEDLHQALLKLSQIYRKVLLVGFSLGGIATCRYFATFGTRIPSNVVGGIGISGGFKIDFITSPRYEKVYQEVLVPHIVDDLVKKYGSHLQNRLDTLNDLYSSICYRDLHRELFVKAGIPNVEEDFVKWKKKMESSPSNVVRPLLLITSLDDPLHHPEKLGLNSLWEPDKNKCEDSEPNEYVGVIMTNGGGHVAWPSKGFSTEGFTYLQTIVSEFCKSTFENSE